MSFGLYTNNNGAILTTDNLSPGYILESIQISSTALTQAQMDSGQGWFTRSLLNTSEFSRFVVIVRILRTGDFNSSAGYINGFTYTSEANINIGAGTYSYRFNFYDAFAPATLLAQVQLIGY